MEKRRIWTPANLLLWSSRHFITKSMRLKKISHLIVTVFGTGHLHYAPGTFGSLVGLIGGGALILSCPHFYIWVAIGAVLVLGSFFIPRYLHHHPHKKDPSEIVIDEVLGQLIALTVCETFFEIGLAFVLFRILDIAKPWPISWADRLEGSPFKNTVGILLDDMLAGALVVPTIWYIRSFY
jgi:phosphatidylglycerophosphatase A